MRMHQIVDKALKRKKINWLKRKKILFFFKKQYLPMIEYADLYGKTRSYDYLLYQNDLLPVLYELGYRLENNFFIKG